MRRVRHCHKVCSLFGTVSALHYMHVHPRIDYPRVGQNIPG